MQGNFGRIALKNSRGEEVVIEVTVDSITVDRSKSGDLSYFDDVDPKLFKKEDLLISTTKRYMRGNVNMEIIFDVSYLEIYADGGLGDRFRMRLSGCTVSGGFHRRRSGSENVHHKKIGDEKHL